MNAETKQSLLKIALAVFGVIFLLVYPVGLVWRPRPCRMATKWATCSATFRH